MNNEELNKFDIEELKQYVRMKENDGDIIDDNLELQNRLMVFLEKLLPTINIWLNRDYQSSKQDNIYNLILMLTTLSVILILALYSIIDSSGATGLLGAIIGYVFGGFFHKKIQRT